MTTIIDVNGLTINRDAIYKVKNKLDKNAPSGFVEEGTTKLPSEGIGNSICCNYFIHNPNVSNKGVFDTGFYEGSPCYRNKELKEVRAYVKKLKTEIVDPYERKYGIGVLDHQNEEFWDDYRVFLHAGRVFSTANVDDLLGLYIAVKTYSLTPIERRGSAAFANSPYFIEDKEKAKTIQEERAENLIDALTTFGALSSNKSLLVNILKYVKFINVDIQVDPVTLKATFYEWLKKSHTNVFKFQEAYKLTQSKKTADVVNFYVLADKLFKKGVLNLASDGQVEYKGTRLGVDLQTVAMNLSCKKELSELKVELLEHK